jgi:hypothetical protein
MVPTLALLLAAESTADVPAAPILALMAFGIVVAIMGHLYGSKATVATGIAILFLATAGMVIGGFVAFNNEETDPREPNAPQDSGF